MHSDYGDDRVEKEDLIEGVEVAGAAEFLDFALDANINLFYLNNCDRWR